MNSLFHHVKKHSFETIRHVRKHKHRYALGTFGTFAVVKMFILFAGFLGLANLVSTFAGEVVELNSGNIVTEYGCATEATSCDLGNKNITSIAPDTFVNHTSLQELYLYSNQISSIESDTFAGLSALTILGLNYNRISSIDSGDFAGLSALTNLILNNNRISSIDSGDFAGLSALTTLHLDNNQISSIDGAFTGLSNLTYLDLGSNQISSIDGAFAGLANLQVLSLGSNQISSIDGAFAGLSNLQQLYLDSNQLSSIDGAFTGLSNLTTLYLDNNLISSIDGAFAGLSNLTTLYLNNNQISSIDGAFAGLANLTELTLPYNKLTGSLDIFCDLTGLRYLKIAFNNFSGPIPSCFFGFENIQGGNLDYNYLSLDGLTPEQEDFLNEYFYYEGDEITDRRRQYFLNDMSVDQTVTASGSDRWDINITYTNGLSALDHAFVYYTMGDFNLQNSSASYTTGGSFKDYGISGDVCYDSFYYNNTGGYRNAINDGFMQAMEISIEDLILEELDYQSGTSDRGTTYIGDGSDMGKYFIDWIQYGDELNLPGNPLLGFMSMYLGLDYTAITGCGTPGIPAYIFDLGALGSEATGTITFRITSQDTIIPTVYIHSSDGFRVDPNTGNNSTIVYLSGQGNGTGNVTPPENTGNITPPSTPSSGPGGGPSLTKDVCPDTRDCSDSYYDNICGKCTLVEKILEKLPFHNAADLPVGNIENSKYSNELNTAYLRAYQYSITTMPSIQQANIEGRLIRKDMAKMITNFAVNILGKDISTGVVCEFDDTASLTKEMQYYAIAACRLGLMGYESDGVTLKKSFDPETEVDRSQFGTILSRLLRGTKNNDGTPYYVNHLNALKTEGIMTKIENPSAKELRGWVMLMMQRIFEKK